MAARKVIITGGAGFIGSAVARLLINTTSHDVLVIDKLTYAGDLACLGSISDHPRFKFLQADICDSPTMQEAVENFRPNVLMHLAAETHVDRSVDDPAVFLETNIKGTFVLLQAALAYWTSLSGCKREEFRFHHVSTDEVFGALGPEGRFDEQSRYRPNSPYAASKASSDHLVRAWHQTYGLPVVLSNCSNNFGPYQFPEKLIPTVVLSALSGKRIPVYGNGMNVRDWLYVDDHAAALSLIAEHGRIGESYNVGADCERTNLDAIRLICHALDELAPKPNMAPHEQLIEYVADRPGHDFRYAIDASRLRREIGWTPTETFESGIRKTVSWYLGNRAWWERYPGERLGLGSRS